MIVLLMPASVSTVDVTVNGKKVGLLQHHASACFTDFAGEPVVADRWLPVGLPSTLEGPTSKAEAALLLLALEGYDPQESMQALRLGPHRVAARPVVGKAS